MSPPGNDESRPGQGSGSSSSGSTTKHRPCHRQDRASARRLDAALRLPPLEDGVRDPWAARAQAEAVAADTWAALALERTGDREWRRACDRLEGLAQAGEQQRANLAHLLRQRASDYPGREQHDLEAAA